MVAMTRTVVRTLTFFGRWFAELTRQPALMLSLVAGPFFLLLTFGAGIRATLPDPEVVVVADESWRSGEEITEEVSDRFNIVAVVREEDSARQMLFRGDADAVLLLPPDPESSFDRGEHAQVVVLTNHIDPAKDAFTRTYVANQAFALNQQTTELMVTDAQETTQQTRGSIEEVRQYTAQARAFGAAGDDIDRLEQQLDQAAQAIDEFNETPPGLVSAPFQVDVRSVALYQPSYTAFYAPAVLVLLLQHLAVTLGALSLTRIRLLGVMDLLRVSPVRPIEMVTGHYLSYTVLCGLVAAALAALLVLALGVPMFGSMAFFVAALALLTLSSLGIGFIIAAVSSSEQQSAQTAMLVLLASIFFSGLIFPLEQIIWPARAISYILPATYGIRSVQDVMLRGDTPPALDLAVLGGAALLLFAATVLLMRREWRPD